MLDSKKKIHESMIRLMDNKSVHDIQVKEIVIVSGVSRSTFYRYYDSIYDVLKEIIAEFTQNLRDCSRDSTLHSYMIYPVDALRYIQGESKVFLALTGPFGDQSFINEFNAQITEYLVGKAVHNNTMPEFIDFRVRFATSGVLSVLRFWLTKRPGTTPEQMSLIFSNLQFDL